MKQLFEEETVLRKFLLGELPQNEQEEVEERLFSDTEFFQQFHAAEDDLIDEYLYGDLSASEQESFTRSFLTTPERRESLRVARVLQKYTSQMAAAVAAEEKALSAHTYLPAKRSILDALGIRSAALRFSLAAAMVVLMVLSAWVVVMRYALRGGPEQQQEQQSPLVSNDDKQPAPPTAQGDPTLRVDPTPQHVAQTNPTPPVQRAAPTRESVAGHTRNNGSGNVNRSSKPATARIFSFMLLPIGQSRGGGDAQEVRLPADARAVNLQIPLIGETGFRRYQATLQTEGKGVIKTWPALRSVKGRGGRIINANVDAEVLTSQTYELTLNGISGDGTRRLISTSQFKIIKSE